MATQIIVVARGLLGALEDADSCPTTLEGHVAMAGAPARTDAALS